MENITQYLIPCPLKFITGIPCPGCGSQRALVELFQANIKTSIETYPPLIPVLFMIFFLFLHLKFDFKNGVTILKISFYINLIIIILNYIKNLIL